MRGIIIFIIPLTMSFNFLLGQSEINAELFRAEQIYRSNENLDQGVLLYKIAFEKKNCDASKVLDAIACAAKINDTTAIIEFIETGIKIGLEPGDFAKLWKHIGNNLSLENILSQTDTSSTRANYLEFLDSVLINKMFLLNIRDQEYRNDDELYDIYQRKNDSLNWKN